MNRARVLVTCPPMILSMDRYAPAFTEAGIEYLCPEVVQTLSEADLVELVPDFDGWIIGDDPATASVFAAGAKGRLRAAVKWGVGTDNVDFEGARRVGIEVSNTPGMFGNEVADVALHYVIALARQTFEIDRGVRDGLWPKPRGISLRGRNATVVGLGDIGLNVARRLTVIGMRVTACDPYSSRPVDLPELSMGEWPGSLADTDVLVMTSALTTETRHMLDATALAHAKEGLRVVNVARGPLIDEAALTAALRTGSVHSAALDVFEIEPLPATSALRALPNVIFGSHNASNTVDAVTATSKIAYLRLFSQLGFQVSE